MEPLKHRRSTEEKIGPVQHTAAYELVVDQIRRVIYLGRFLPGDKLPAERDLAHQLGVSRTTVREAVRLLEGERLIKVKRGASGGIIVNAPHQKSVTERRNFLAENQRDLNDVFEFRIAVECHAARLAAERRTKRDLKFLLDMQEKMDGIFVKVQSGGASVSEYNAMDTRFHIAIAAASRNRRIERATEEIRAAMFLPVGSIFEKLSDKANVHHRPIWEAIRDRDAKQAENQMREHIQEGYDALKSFLRGK